MVVIGVVVVGGAVVVGGVAVDVAVAFASCCCCWFCYCCCYDGLNLTRLIKNWLGPSDACATSDVDNSRAASQHIDAQTHRLQRHAGTDTQSHTREHTDAPAGAQMHRVSMFSFMEAEICEPSDVMSKFDLPFLGSTLYCSPSTFPFTKPTLDVTSAPLSQVINRCNSILQTLQ